MRAAACGAVALVSLVAALGGCTTTQSATAPSAKMAPMGKPGFYTEVKDGGMTIKSNDAAVIDESLAAK